MPPFVWFSQITWTETNRRLLGKTPFTYSAKSQRHGSVRPTLLHVQERPLIPLGWDWKLLLAFPHKENQKWFLSLQNLTAPVRKKKKIIKPKSIKIEIKYEIPTFIILSNRELLRGEPAQCVSLGRARPRILGGAASVFVCCTEILP